MASKGLQVDGDRTSEPRRRSPQASPSPVPTSAPEKVDDGGFPDIQRIRDAIPAHCFESSTWRSLGYVARDLMLAGGLGWAALTFIPGITSPLWRAVAWITYGYAQGLVCTGIWILAHEAGHGAFSPHRVLNDFVGWVLHSALLVPYFSWKFSHHRHHRFTGHMDKDMVFVPATAPAERVSPSVSQSWVHTAVESMEDTPVVQLTKLVAHQLGGWPAYLLFNISAGLESKQRDEERWWCLSHFDPVSAVFRPSEAIFILLSDLGLAITLSILYWASTQVGWTTVAALYLVPYLWVHHWLIAITYLHHNHPDVPHYNAEGWSYVKGALATIDRDFGWVGRHLFHGIIDTHVVHHLFPRIPFYKAEEATEAISNLLGDLYHRDKRSFMGQLWSTFTTCKYVEDNPIVPGAMRWVD